MPRLRQVPRAEAQADIVLTMYNQLFGERDPVAEPGTATGTPGDWWTVFALEPDVLRHAVQGFSLYRTRAVDPVLRELGQTRAGWAVGSQFVFSQHCKACRALGISDDKIDAIPSWSTSDLFTPLERAVLAFTDGLVYDRGRVPDGVIEALKANLPDEQILELAYITGTYVMHATICRALRLEYDDRDESVVEIAAPEGQAACDIAADIASRTES